MYLFILMFILGLVSHFDDITVRSMRALYSTEEEWYTLVKNINVAEDCSDEYCVHQKVGDTVD